MKQTGIIVLVLGLVLTIFTTVTFFTRETVVDIGAVHITHDEPHNVAWPPIAGVVVMGIGAVMLWQAGKRP